MSTVMNTRTFFGHQSKLIKVSYNNSAMKKPLKYQGFFSEYEGDPDRAFFNMLSVYGFGLLAEKTEGSIPTVDVAGEGRLSTFAYASYALRYVVTKEMAQEDAKKLIGKLPGMLKYSVDQTLENLIWSTLNFGFNPLVPLADGQPLFSYAHPLAGASATIGSATYSNYLGNVPLTVESVEQAQLLMAMLPDDRGLLVSRTPKTLLYNPVMSQVAQEVIGSGYYPNSDENRINAVAGSVKLMPVEYITATNGVSPWFIAADKGQPGTDSHTLFYNIKRNEDRSYVDDATESLNHVAEIRLTYGAVDARGIVGSAG